MQGAVGSGIICLNWAKVKDKGAGVQDGEAEWKSKLGWGTGDQDRKLEDQGRESGVENREAGVQDGGAEVRMKKQE